VVTAGAAAAIPASIVSKVGIVSAVIPGVREPGLHQPPPWLWIPGPALTRRPGMTARWLTRRPGMTARRMRAGAVSWHRSSAISAIARGFAPTRLLIRAMDQSTRRTQPPAAARDPNMPRVPPHAHEMAASGASRCRAASCSRRGAGPAVAAAGLSLTNE
jgi:hypothetical protein